MAHMVIFDLDRPNLAHARVDCEQHHGFLEFVEQQLGGSCDDPDVMEEIAFRCGLAVPADLADHARPCPHCTLVAAPFWRAAA